MEDEIHFNGEKCTYLLPSGFSGADILFANCCFWAQQNYWIERKVDVLSCDEGNQSKLSFPDLGGEVNKSHDAMKPLTLSLSPKLEAYLRQCSLVLVWSLEPGIPLKSH